MTTEPLQVSCGNGLATRVFHVQCSAAGLSRHPGDVIFLRNRRKCTSDSFPLAGSHFETHLRDQVLHGLKQIAIDIKQSERKSFTRAPREPLGSNQPNALSCSAV